MLATVIPLTISKFQEKQALNMAGSQDNDRGKPIKFTGGKYASCSGWIDKGKDKRTCRSVYVIILLNDGHTKHTRVLKESIKPESTPTNLAEALMKEYPDIHQILKKLTSLLAQVELDSKETDAMVTHFHEKLLQAQEKQEGLGGRARWRKRVRFVFATSRKKRDAKNLSLSSRSGNKLQQ